MQKKYTILLVVLTLLMLFPSATLAAEINNQPAPQPPVNLVPSAPTPGSNQSPDKQIDNSTVKKEIKTNITNLSEDVVVQKDERVYGNITTVSGNITIFGEVFGNITTATGNVNIKDTARVTGNVTVGTGRFERDPGVTIYGNVVQGSNTPIRFSNGQSYNEHNYPVETSFSTRAFNSFTSMLGMLAIVAIILSIFPKNLEKMLGALEIEPGRVVIIGILGWCILPFAMLISIITIIGPLIIGLGAFISLLVGVTIVSYLLGDKIKELIKLQNDNKILIALIGLFVLWLASLLPIAMPFIGIICGIIGMGVVLVTKFGTGRPWFPAKRTTVNNTSVEHPPVEPVISEGGKKNESPKEK